VCHETAENSTAAVIAAVEAQNPQIARRLLAEQIQDSFTGKGVAGAWRRTGLRKRGCRAS